MSILTQCRHCGKKYRFPQSRAGRRVRCKECHSTIRIPQPQPVEDEFDDDELEYRRPATRRRRTSKQKTHRALISLAIVGVAVVFVGIGIWAILSLAGHNAPANLAEITPDTWNVVVDTSSEPPPAPPAEMQNFTVKDIDQVFFSSQNDRWCAVQYTRQRPQASIFEFIDLYTGEKKHSGNELSRWEETIDISRDAKYAVGLTRLDKTHRERELQAYSLETQQMTTIDVGEQYSLQTARFLPNDQLLVAKVTMVEQSRNSGFFMGTGPGVITIYDLTHPRTERSFATENGNLRSSTISRGGRYFVFTSKEKLYAYDINTGKLVASTSLPYLHDGIGSPCEYLSFSHDGTKLAGSFGNTGSPRILCWNWATGRGVSDFSNLPHYDSSTAIDPLQTNDLEWLPDDSGWIYQRHFIVDPETGNELGNFLISKGEGSRKFFRISSNAMALVSHELPRQPVQLTAIPIDLSLINRTWQAARSHQDAYLSVSKKVSVNVEIEQLQHGSKEATHRVIAEIARKKLETLGFEIADNQPTTLRVVYSETKGDVLVQMKERTGITVEPKPDGEAVTSTRAAIAVMWQVNGMDDPVWQAGFEVDPSVIILTGEVSDAAARQESLRKASGQLARIVLPYFIPKDPTLAILPDRVLLLPEEAK